MNARVLRRFVILLAVATGAMLTVWTIVLPMVRSPPGDYETRQGDILLGDGKLDEALTRFDEALAASPDHRGALMGRALVFIQSENYPDAKAELTYLIRFLTRSLDRSDITGRGVLAAAYANRGIVHDRLGHYRKALEDYVAALRTDEGTLEGPGFSRRSSTERRGPRPCANAPGTFTNSSSSLLKNACCACRKSTANSACTSLEPGLRK